MRPANERRRYNVTSSLIGWVHTLNDPSKSQGTWECQQTKWRAIVWGWFHQISLQTLKRFWLKYIVFFVTFKCENSYHHTILHIHWQQHRQYVWHFILIIIRYVTFEQAKSYCQHIFMTKILSAPASLEWSAYWSRAQYKQTDSSTLKPDQSGWYFPNDIIKYVFPKELLILLSDFT